jgi:hypothetical protein
MSNTATLIPLPINRLTINSPIPLHPPVTTATSSLQFHLFFSLVQRPAFNATLFNCLFATPVTPRTRHHFSAFTICATRFGSRRNPMLPASRSRSPTGPFVRTHSRAAETMGLNATCPMEEVTRPDARVTIDMFANWWW